MVNEGYNEFRLYGLLYDCTYENFLEFRKNYLAPSMGLPFVEEEYDKEIWNEIWTHWDLIEEISRGHGKSEFGIQLLVYLGLCQPYNPKYERELEKKHRMKDFLIVSSDNTTVSELRDRMIEYFLGNDNLLKYVPDGLSKKDTNAKWNMQKINLVNGTTFYFRPIKTKRGLHVDFIWVDDPTTESSTLTDKQTLDHVDGAIIPMGTAKQAIFLMTGTPIRMTDILTIKSRSGGYFHKKRPALINDEPISKRFTKNMLDDIKRKIGSMKFSAEYLLNPVDDGISLIKQSWIDDCKNKSFSFQKTRGGFDNVVLGVDFSFGDTEYSRGGGDYFVAVVLGIDSNNKKRVINIYRRNDLSTVEQLSYIKELHAVYKFDKIALEFNSIRALAGNLKELNLPLKLYNTGTVDEKDKKKPDFSRVISVSKRNLIIRQGTHLENEMVILPYGDDSTKSFIDLYAEEATSWALEEDKVIELGRHPDIPIALGYALECVDESMFVIQW